MKSSNCKSIQPSINPAVWIKSIELSKKGSRWFKVTYRGINPLRAIVSLNGAPTFNAVDTIVTFSSLILAAKVPVPIPKSSPILTSPEFRGSSQASSPRQRVAPANHELLPENPIVFTVRPDIVIHVLLQFGFHRHASVTDCVVHFFRTVYVDLARSVLLGGYVLPNLFDYESFIFVLVHFLNGGFELVLKSFQLAQHFLDTGSECGEIKVVFVVDNVVELVRAVEMPAYVVVVKEKTSRVEHE
ncbi:hypothetical protein MIMGU_mgv1a012698mg [Erythranthe guttata]|uniref:Uncharacterized protein n=1 Tax=Erythranthe guttata TaxID=4155 RepID=A0A022QR74_ERYGU|nr:hypothetical protein MIMGU_mgv1a012698mg [Erythranthe guttata]